MQSFFATIDGISSFFSKSPKRTAAIEKVKRIGAPSNTRWTYRTRALKTLVTDYEVYRGFFRSLLEQNESWDVTAVQNAAGFENTLKRTNFVLVLTLIHEIFQICDSLFSILQNVQKTVVVASHDI